MKALKIISFFFLIVAATTSSQNSNTNNSFQSTYIFGDGTSDTGNSIRIPPFGPFLPSTRYPYGRTFPGYPTGRWSDGLVASDYGARRIGLPNIKPYLSLGLFTRNDGVIFAVEGSTLLNNSFFNSKNIDTPSYNTPLSTQLTWFRTYRDSVCKYDKNVCVNGLPSNSIVVFAFSEVNDLTYALLKGKSFEEVTTYIPRIVQAQIDAAREMMELGVTNIVVTNAAPLGCYPYILTAFRSNDPSAYGPLGCFRAVSNITVMYNTALQTAFNCLSVVFPNVNLQLADFNMAARSVINQTGTLGPNNPALRSCCGIGGKYNYDSRRFCGSLTVPVCPNPYNYVYWDGRHFTQEAYRRMINIVLKSTST